MNGPSAVASKRPIAATDDANTVFGEYRPSFLAGTTSSAKTKKTSAGKRRDAARPPPRNNLLVFDDDLDGPGPDPAAPGDSEVGAGDRHGGGGGKHLLLRRPRQPPTTVNGSVGSLNDLSDEIEEVIL